MRSTNRLALLLAACGLTACEPSEIPTASSSTEAAALLADVQQQFTLPQRDYHRLLDAVTVAPRSDRRQPVLPSQRGVRLGILGQRIHRHEAQRIEATSGATAAQAMEIRDHLSSVSVAVTLLEATDAPAELVDGYVVYRGGHQSGADVLHQLGVDRHEDFVVFHSPPAESIAHYRLDLGAGVAGLRLVEGTLELLDQDGLPRLRMQRPYTVDATGNREWATVALDGCAFDSSPQAPFYREVTPPGAASCTVTLGWQGGAYPLLLDPIWETADNMVSPREGHAMALLTTGDVLAAGGSDGNAILATAEVYSVSANLWAVTASMPNGGRYGAQVASPGANINTRGAPVLIGGFRGLDTITNVRAVERYNVASGTWSTLTQSLVARRSHAAVEVANSAGTVLILVTGGVNDAGTVLNSGEIGTGTGSWTSQNFGNGSNRRANHSMTRLANGRVLVTGGYGGSQSNAYLSTSRLYNNNTRNWGGAPTLTTARKDHAAVRLGDGRILVLGGVTAGEVILDGAEYYTFGQASPQFAAIASRMGVARAGHRAVLLTDGTVLISGGLNNSGTVLASAEIFDPLTNLFSNVPAAPSTARVFHDQTLLNDGRVVLCGGLTSFTSGVPTDSCELFDPSSF